MPFEIIRADITKLSVDAIVNATNNELTGYGGVDRKIRKAAGKDLDKECTKLGGLETGEAKITKGYDLPSRYIIHTSGPLWKGGEYHEEQFLYSCYKNSLELAVEYGIKSIAFPLVSSGTLGFPKEKAMGIAMSVINEYLMRFDMTIYLVVYDKNAFLLSEKLFSSEKAYIDDNYIQEHSISEYSPSIGRKTDSGDFSFKSIRSDMLHESPSRSLDDLMAELDESFSEHLLRQIDLKGKTDIETYKKANIDRKLFSKIRSDKNYRPSKATAIALCIALELSLDETRDMLQKAGFALSHSSKADIIIEYFIREKNYNIHEINEALFSFEQNLLGA